MSTIFDDPERRPVPRWRTWKDAVRLGEADAVSTRKVVAPSLSDLADLARLRHDWEENRTVPFAADFVGAAFASGASQVASEAARFLLESGRVVTRAARDLAELVLTGTGLDAQPLDDPPDLTTEQRRGRIGRRRKAIRAFPRNPLAYMDLARDYVALGQREPAQHFVEMALGLAPHSRFVLRSASRFFLHVGDPERAHDLVRTATAARTDPWLLAAEIALASAADRAPFLLKAGRQALASGGAGPAHLSELASAIGTLEWHAGNMRHMRRFFRQALQQPTENTVAQAEWISRRNDGLDIDPEVLKTPRSYEALAWAQLEEAHWHESLTAAGLWLRDEPFAKRPAAFGSWVATVDGDYVLAARFARQGLLKDPRDFTLLNNLVVALANLGETEEARQQFRLIDPDAAQQEHAPTYLATKGLLHFRLGLPNEGRRLYHLAVSEAIAKKDVGSAILALLHLALEEARFDMSTARTLADEAKSHVAKLNRVGQAASSRLVERVDFVTHQLSVDMPR